MDWLYLPWDMVQWQDFVKKNYLNFISHKGQHIAWSAEQLNISYLLTYLLTPWLSESLGVLNYRCPLTKYFWRRNLPQDVY